MSFKVFCDTNLPIAYVFHLNSLHLISKEVFEFYSQPVWSKNVLHEFDKIYFKKLENIKILFHDLQKYLENPSKELYSLEDLLHFVRTHYSDEEMKHVESSIEPFWREYIGFESRILYFNIKNSIDACLTDLAFTLKVNKDNLKELMQMAPQRTNLYHDIDGLLKSCGVHGSDRKIILDGHDFACFSDSPVDFVTFDKDCYSGAKNVELLCFNSIKGINDFN